MLNMKNHNLFPIICSASPAERKQTQPVALLLFFCLALLAFGGGGGLLAAQGGPTVVCSGKDAGGYAAFPDVCRLKDGSLMVVFYSGYGHVSLPKEVFPKGGRIQAVYSTNEGQTWSAPATIQDSSCDDRDPSVALLPDGTLLLNWFTYEPEKKGKDGIRTWLAHSTDQGKTWSTPTELQLDIPEWSACSSPVRVLPDGSLILGLYHEPSAGIKAFGSTVKSYNGGKTWTDYAAIGKGSNVQLDAETDVLALRDGRLFAALRGGKGDNMHFSYSQDMGKTWQPVHDFGFQGHCPYLFRHSSGVILLGQRLPHTAVCWSPDETKTWQGPLQVDAHHGAYPSMVELKDGTVLFVFYEEGDGSSIVACRLKVSEGKVEVVTH
jgi:hypothetical protein